MRAKTVQENMGGSGYAVYGGGARGGYGNSIGRGNGFGGSSNNGGPNVMYTYDIKPLNQVLQQPGTPQGDHRYIHVGSEVSGKVLGKDLEVYGKILDIKKDAEQNILYYIVQDLESAEKFQVDPTALELINHEERPDGAMRDFSGIDESFYPSLLERKSLQDQTDDIKGKIERSKKLSKEMKEKIIPMIVINGIHGTKYNEGRVTYLKTPKISGKSFLGNGIGADKDGFYTFTHRARSKSYPELKDIPNKDIKFIESTG